jgi:hypothetical protein
MNNDNRIEVKVSAYLCRKQNNTPLIPIETKEIKFVSDKYIKGHTVAIVIDDIEFYVKQDQIEKILQFIKDI